MFHLKDVSVPQRMKASHRQLCGKRPVRTKVEKKLKLKLKWKEIGKLAKLCHRFHLTKERENVLRYAALMETGISEQKVVLPLLKEIKNKVQTRLDKERAAQTLARLNLE